MKTICIYIYDATKLEEYIALAKIIDKYFNLIFIVSHQTFWKERLEQSDIKQQYSFIELDKKEKFKNSLSTKFIEFISKQYTKRPKLYSFIMYLRTISVGQIFYEHLLYAETVYYSRQLDSFFKEKSVDLLILLDDRGKRTVEAALVDSAIKNNIKIFLPFFLFSNPTVSLIKLKDNKKYKLENSSSFYQKRIFNKHKYMQKNGLFPYTAFELNVLNRLQILPRYPWLVGYGKCDAFAIPYQELYNVKYKDAPINKKFTVLGDIAYIELYKKYKNKIEIKSIIKKKYNLSKNKIIIITMASLYEHRYTSLQKHWEINENAIIQALKFKEYDIFLTLHPNANKQKYLFLEEKYSIIILNDRLMNVLPIADIFISNTSNVLIWGVLCHVKTILYDVVFDDTLYDTLKSIARVKKVKDLYKSIQVFDKNEVDFSREDRLLNRDTIFSENIAENYKNILYSLMRK